MKNILIVFLFFSGFSVYSQQNQIFNSIEFNGYIQVRVASDFKDNRGFALRRLKLWMKSKPEFSEHWSYKVQVTFSSFSNEKFFLQDVYGQYNWENSSVKFGQFVPRFSLQRFQHDYLIPALERSRVVNVLIPDGFLGVRDIGVQYNLKAVKSALQFNFGLFNGYGIKTYRFNNKGFMVVQNLSYLIPVNGSRLKIGFSTMFRKADKLLLPGVLSDTVLYTGNEMRFDVYGSFISRYVNLQGEYLRSVVQGGGADGFYGLLTVKINKKNQAYVVYDSFLNSKSPLLNNPWYLIGYNYFFKNYKLMLTLQEGLCQLDTGWSYQTSVEFQMFFH